MGKDGKTKKTEPTIEEIYKKKNPREHALTVPGMYVGSIEVDEKEMWIYSAEKNKIIKKLISFVPGFYKIVDELFVNARDHTDRDKTCNLIKIFINKKEGTITVWNNGNGIPAVIHQEHKIYVPELLERTLVARGA